MLSYRLGTVNDFHWGFKPVLSYSKPHLHVSKILAKEVVKVVLKVVTRLVADGAPLTVHKGLQASLTGNTRTRQPVATDTIPINCK